MSLSPTTIPLVAQVSKADVLKSLEILQNLAFLIEQQADSTEEVREYAKTMHLVLNEFGHRLMHSTNDQKLGPD